MVKMTNSTDQVHPMELLAPAGTVDCFETAVDAGADAVYIGVPDLNARALSKNFSWREIAAMISYGQRRQRKVYLAMNSLLKEDEIPQAVESLAMIAELEPDGLIVQDLGIYNLANRFFPNIPLHASTLFGAHNSLAVEQFARMGFSRVVLARELTLLEIALIKARTDVELEVFIHGALCFSYSGLCLFSSSLGGKSSLRGRCVQPCRRRYTWQEKGDKGKGGYLFSMSDLCGVDYVDDLRKIGIRSLKIEGRLRSAHYVGSVVRAYRAVLDAPAGDVEAKKTAMELIRSALGRKTSKGFFMATKPVDLIAPYHSGNIGLFIGSVEKAHKDGLVQIRLKEELNCGDRLRLHQEESGERNTFTVKQMMVEDSPSRTAPAGTLLNMRIPVKAEAGDSLYKVDTSEGRASEGRTGVFTDSPRKKVNLLPDKQLVDHILNHISPRADVPSAGKRGRSQTKGRALQFWLKVDNLNILKQQPPFMPDRVVVMLDRETMEQYFRGPAFLKLFHKKLIWELPPVILENELKFYQKAVARLAKAGNRDWRLGHIGQRLLFRQKTVSGLHGGHTLNVLNSAAVDTLRNLGIKDAQVALETDGKNLMQLCDKRKNIGFMVYGRPPLFTSRVTAKHLRYNRPFLSPKGEKYFLVNRKGLTLALPDQSFDLTHALRELAAAGLQYVLMDLSNQMLKSDEAMRILGRLQKPPTGRHRANTFNYYNELR